MRTSTTPPTPRSSGYAAAARWYTRRSTPGTISPASRRLIPRPGREDALAFIEPRLLRELKHQHIVEIIDAQPDGDRREFVTMVMPEYVGGDLLHVIADGRQLSVGQAIEWAIQIATALDYLHTVKGYLHRDGALSWRIVRRVDPTALREACSSAPAEDQRQRPESQWTAQLIEAVPGIRCEPRLAEAARSAQPRPRRRIRRTATPHQRTHHTIRDAATRRRQPALADP